MRGGEGEKSRESKRGGTGRTLLFNRRAHPLEEEKGRKTSFWQAAQPKDDSIALEINQPEGFFSGYLFCGGNELSTMRRGETDC